MEGILRGNKKPKEKNQCINYNYDAIKQYTNCCSISTNRF